MAEKITMTWNIYFEVVHLIATSKKIKFQVISLPILIRRFRKNISGGNLNSWQLAG
jgi:hypothetical protein